MRRLILIPTLFFVAVAFAFAGDFSGPPRALTPYVLCQSHIPFVVPSSGSMANNGALTVTTTLPTTYTSAYVQLPANAIQAGSAAGWYYAVFSSGTAATVYQETYTLGSPTIPASPTPWVSTGPGAYTQTSGTVSGPGCTVPGGLLGTNGSIQAMASESHNNSAGNKTVAGNYGGYLFGTAQLTATAQAGFIGGFSNAAATNKQTPMMSSGNWSTQNSTSTTAFGAVDSTADKTVRLVTTMNTPATDYQVIVNVVFMFVPGTP